MKNYIYFFFFLTLASCNSATEITPVFTTEPVATTSAPFIISDSLIEQLDQSIIVDSFEVMKYDVGILNKTEVIEIRDMFFEDGWRLMTSEEINFFYKKKILKAGKYWVWDYAISELKVFEIGIVKDDNDFLANMAENAENPDDQVCSIRLIRNYKEIDKDLYNSAYTDPLNHLRFSKGEFTTKIMGIEVMNKDLDNLYYYEDAEKEVAKMKLRLPNYKEIVMMNKFKILIGGFSSNRDNSSYYWTTALVRGNNHHMAMYFSGGSIVDIDNRDISFAFLDVSLSDRLSVRPLK